MNGGDGSGIGRNADHPWAVEPEATDRAQVVRSRRGARLPLHDAREAEEVAPETVGEMLRAWNGATRPDAAGDPGQASASGRRAKG